MKRKPAVSASCLETYLGFGKILRLDWGDDRAIPVEKAAVVKGFSLSLLRKRAVPAIKHSEVPVDFRKVWHTDILQTNHIRISHTQGIPVPPFNVPYGLITCSAASVPRFASREQGSISSSGSSVSETRIVSPRPSRRRLPMPVVRRCTRSKHHAHSS